MRRLKCYAPAIGCMIAIVLLGFFAKNPTASGSSRSRIRQLLQSSLRR